MLCYCIGTVNDFIGGLNHFSAIANQAFTPHLLENKKKMQNCIYLLNVGQCVLNHIQTTCRNKYMYFINERFLSYTYYQNRHQSALPKSQDIINQIVFV